MASLDENKAIARCYLEAWRTLDLDTFEALLAPEFVDYMMGAPRTRGQLLDEARRRKAAGLLDDVRNEIEAIIAEGDMVAVTYKSSATHIASVRPLSYTGMFILKITGDKCTGGWGEFDRLGIREQMAEAQGTPST